MAASGSRERRTAIWPWLVMPLVVLVAFYALNRIHKHPGPAVVEPPPAGSAPAAPVPSGQ
jgi:hypothetical protein